MFQTSTPTGVMPPGGSSTANVGSLVGQLVVGATTPTEITAAMLATLAGSSELSEQRKVLLQLTEKVEEQKRAIQQQMELTQRTKIPLAGGSTVESLTQTTMLEPNRMEPVTVAVVTPAISVEKPVQSIPMPIVTSDLYTPKSELGLSVVTKTHVATVNPIVDNKVQPVLSEGSVSTTQPAKSSLPADSKKVPDAIPNVARKHLTVKAGITPATTGVVAPFSGNLALLPPSVQMLLTGGAVQTPDSPCDNTQELQPATEGSSSSTGAEVKSPVDGNVSSNEVHTAKDAEKTSEDNPSNKAEIKQNSMPEFMETALSDVTPSVGAHNAAAVRDLERTLQPPEAARVVLNPHGDVDYRIAPTGHFPTPPQLPPETGPQSSWQPAFQTKPQEASSGSPGVKAGPQPEWAPAFPAAVPPKQPDWAPVVPATKPLWEPAFPAATPPGVSRPADPRQRAAEERMRNAAFPPNAGRMDGSRQGEGAVRPMWNVRRPPVRPWSGAPPRLRFGAIPPPRPPVCMPMPPLPPSIPNAPPMPSGDIDERIRPQWPPGGDGRPWAQSGIRPLLPQPENTECKPAAVPTVDLSALGKFAVEFLKEQQQKGRGGVPPITSGNSSTVGMPLPANVLGIPSPANPALGIRPPAPPVTRGQTDPLLGVSVDKRSDTDERCRTDSGQPIQQVTRSAAKFHDVASPSQVGSLERQRQVKDNVTSLSQQQGNSKQVISSLAETANQRNAKSMQDKVKATVSGEKANFVSEKKEGAKSDVEVANPFQVAKNDTDSEMTGKSKSKWVPLGSVASKQPQNRAVIAPSSGGTVQRVTEEVNVLPSANKGGSTPTKLTPVQIKPLGKNLIETKTSQLLDPAETKPLLTSLAEIKLAQQSESAAPVDVHSTRMLRGPTRSSSGDVQNKSQPSDKCQSKVESSEDTTLVKPDTDSRSSGEAVSVSEQGSSKLLKDDKMNEKPRTNRTASTSRSTDTGRRHRTRSRSRERIKKERRRSPSRDRYPASRRDRRRSRSKSRGRDRRAAKHRSRSRSRDREAKRRSRSRDRGVRRRTRSRSRGRSGVKRRSRSRSRDRDAKRRSRSRSRERRTSFRSDRGRHEKRLENVGRRSPPPPIRHERGSREERVSNDEGFSHGLPQDVDHRAAGLGDRDERYSTAIPSLGEHVGHTDTAATKSHEKNILEGSRDTDERVEVGRQVLASPFVRNAVEPWSGRAPPGESRVGHIRASGDTDDRDQWRHHGGQELFAEPQGRPDLTVPDPRAQPHGDAHMSPATFTRQPGDRPFTLRPPCDQAMPRGPPGWMPRMMGPRPPLVRPVGLPEQPPFLPRGPWSRGPPAGPPGGRPGPW